MKKIFVGLLSVLLLTIMVFSIPVLATSDVSQAQWRAEITATNSGTAASGVAATFTLNTESMITMGMCDSNSDDVTVMINGVDTAFQSGFGGCPWVFDAGDFGASSNKIFDLYSKDVAGGSIRAFPADSGLVVADHSSIEIIGDGAVSLDDVKLKDGVVFNKPGAITSSYSGGALTSSLYSLAGGAYPSIAGSATSSDSSGTNHTVNLPTGIVSGQLLLINFTIPSTGITITFPAGWTNVWSGNSNYGTGITVSGGTWKKVANGTEGASITVTTSSSIATGHVALRVAGNKSDVVACTAASPGYYGTSSPDSLALSPSWGAKNTLWLSMVCQNGGSWAAYPSSYIGGRSTSDYSCVSWRQNNTATEDPSSWSFNGFHVWTACTLAISPIDTLGTTVSASVSAEEHTNVTTSVNGTSGKLELWVDGTRVANTSLAYGVIDTTDAYQIGGTGTIYFSRARIIKSGSAAATYQFEKPDARNCVLTNGTGTATGSPITLGLGNNTVTITGAGTFVINNPYGWAAIAASGTASISSSPVRCGSGQTRGGTTNTSITVSGTGNIIVAVYPCLLDLTANTNDAFPSLRLASSDPDVSATVSSFQPVNPAVPAPPSSSSSGVLGDLTAPSQMYLEGVYDYLPGADAINEILDEAEVPRALWWFPFIFIGIAIFGMIVFDWTKVPGGEGSLLTQCIVCDVLLGGFAIMGPIMLWPAILFWVPAGALILSRKHYSYG